MLFPASGFLAGLLLLLSAVAAGVACGLVLLRRVAESRRWRSLAIIALAAVGVWLLVGVPNFMGQRGIGGAIVIDGFSLISFASPLVEVAVSALGRPPERVGATATRGATR